MVLAPERVLKFEVDFDTAASDVPDSWVDLTDRISSREQISITVGPGSSGECKLTLHNRDRELDPTNPDATYQLWPMRHARLRVTVEGETFDLYRGFVEEWPPHWPEAAQAQIRVRLVDGLAWLALDSHDADLPAQKAGERIDALLDLAGWPEALRDLDEGQARLQPVEQTEASIRRLVGDAVDAEDGYLWVAGDGKITFRDRHATLGVDPVETVGPDGIPVAAVTPDFGAGPMVNVARVERADGRVFKHEDAESRHQFGPRDFPYRDLALPDVEAVALAQWAVVRYGWPSTWLHRLMVRTWQRPTRVLAVGPIDVVGFTHTPPGDGEAQEPVVVGAITHRISNVEWLTWWDCAPYFGEGPWLTLDTDAEFDGEWMLLP